MFYFVECQSIKDHKWQIATVLTLRDGKQLVRVFMCVCLCVCGCDDFDRQIFDESFFIFCLHLYDVQEIRGSRNPPFQSPPTCNPQTPRILLSRTAVHINSVFFGYVAFIAVIACHVAMCVGPFGMFVVASLPISASEHSNKQAFLCVPCASLLMIV